MSREHLTQLLEDELSVYREIDRKLVAYAESLSSTLAGEMLDDHKKISTLLQQQTDIFSQLLQSQDFQKEYPEFFRFITETMNLEDIQEKDRLHLSLNIFKLMQCDAGRNLIHTLNELNNSNALNIRTDYVSGDTFSIGLPGFKKAKSKPTHGTKSPPNFLSVCYQMILQCLQALLVKLTLQNPEEKPEKTSVEDSKTPEPKKPTAWNNLSFNIPENNSPRKPLLFTGINQPLIIEIDFIAIAHELVHILHFATGIHRELESRLDMRTTNPLMYLYSKWFSTVNHEEHFTIEGDEDAENICENTFRDAFHCSPRGGHISSPLTTEPPKETGLKTHLWLAKKRMGKGVVSMSEALSLRVFNSPHGDPNGRIKLPDFPSQPTNYVVAV